MNYSGDYTPQLGERHILMISDYVSSGFDAHDVASEHELILGIKEQMEKWSIPFYFAEVKSLSELKTVLLKHKPDETVIFNWCEEIYDQPGKSYLVPELLESLGFIYTGSTKELMLKLESKELVKKLLVENKIPTPEYLIVVDFEKQEAEINKFNNLPAIIKSLMEHGSAGITYDSIVETSEALKLKVKEMLQKFPTGILIEEYIKGEELAVSVWGNKPPVVLPIHKIAFEEGYNSQYEIQNYESKWNRDSVEFNTTKAVETHYPTEEDAIIKEVALEAYKKLGCVDFVRMEMRYRNKVPYVIDVNDNPCFLPRTSFILAAQKAGNNYGEILAKICEFALNRHEQK